MNYRTHSPRRRRTESPRRRSLPSGTIGKEYLRWSGQKIVKTTAPASRRHYRQEGGEA